MLTLLNIIMGLMICLLFIKLLKIYWRFLGNLLEFGGHWCKTSLNKSSWNNWVVFWSVLQNCSTADQILFLEFSKDGPADNRDKYTCGGSANQPVILL